MVETIHVSIGPVQLLLLESMSGCNSKLISKVVFLLIIFTIVNYTYIAFVLYAHKELLIFCPQKELAN